MSTSYALLGLLDRSPSYGYELKKAYDRFFSVGKPLAFGQVYSTLSRLHRDGKVGEVADDESSRGPERIKYQITDAGVGALGQWLAAPEPPVPALQATMYLKVVLAMFRDGDPNEYLDAQRRAHIERMRQLTRARMDAPIGQVLLIDHAIFHLEADMRWIDLTSDRLVQLKGELKI